MNISFKLVQLYGCTFNEPFKHEVIVHCFSNNLGHIIVRKFNKCIALTSASLKYITIQLRNNWLMYYTTTMKYYAYSGTARDFDSFNFAKLREESFKLILKKAFRNVSKVNNSSFNLLFVSLLHFFGHC